MTTHNHLYLFFIQVSIPGYLFKIKNVLFQTLKPCCSNKTSPSYPLLDKECNDINSSSSFSVWWVVCRVSMWLFVWVRNGYVHAFVAAIVQAKTKVIFVWTLLSFLLNWFGLGPKYICLMYVILAVLFELQVLGSTVGSVRKKYRLHHLGTA